MPGGKRKPNSKPPKSAPKKKLTKAEKDKLKQEEEEKRLKEEEDEKRKKEEEEAERAEREKADAEHRKNLEAEVKEQAHVARVEAKRRKAQLEELNEIINDTKNLILNQNDTRRKNAKWERYMRCDGSPDPTIAGEINTYINLQREDNSHNTIDEVLAMVRHARSLIEELEFIIADTPEGELTEKELNRYKQTIIELEDLINDKLDMASHDITLKATQLMSQETLNLEATNKSDDVRLFIWGNLCKNPRIKSFEFPDASVGFLIPKLLTLSDCAYRSLITKFDHYSHRSRSFYPRKKVPEVDVPTIEEGDQPIDEAAEDKPQADGQEEEEGVERETTEDLMALLNKPQGEDDEDKEAEQKEENAPEQQAEVLEADLIKTPEPEDFEDFDGDEDMVDLRAYRPLGGIFKFNLLHLPPQPRQVGTWTITQHAEPSHLNYVDYIADDVNPQAQLLKQKAQADDDPSTKREDRPPINVQLKLPNEYFFFEDPLLARWDDKAMVWRQDGFQDTTFVEETRRLSFKTCYFGTFALMQDVHINMPFQSWEIRPKGINHCLFTLIAAIVELEIEIKETECCLRGPSDRVEVAHLRGKWIPLKQFMQALKDTGINIFPNQDSHKYVTIQDKNAITETRLYEQMGLTASTMAYSWSKWNGEKESEKIIFQAAPQLTDEPLTEDDWSLFMVTRKRTMKLRMSEFDDDFSEDYAEGTEFHADMYHMSLQIAPDEGKKRIKDSSHTFTYTVTELLKSTRPLIYA